MRPRPLLVLLLLVMALGSFIWFYERDLPSTDERVEQSKKLLRLDPDSVRAIELISGEQRARLERVASGEDASAGGSEGAGEEWSLVQPRAGRADSGEVDAFLRRLGELVKERTLDDAAREQLGLEPPRAQVTLETQAGDVVLRFGSEIPASSNTLVEVGSGPPFHVVAGGLLDDVARPPDEWRSRDAIPVARSRISKLEILEPSGGVTLERSSHGFRLTSPILDEADEAGVSELLTELVDLEVDEFLDQPEAEGGFVPAATVRLTLADAGDEPILVEIGAPEAGDELRAVRVDGQRFKAQTDLASLLARPPSEWRSASWSALDSFEIRAFRVSRGGGSASELARRDGEWWHGEDEVEYEKANRLLRALSAATGVPAEPAAAALIEAAEAPLIEVELEADDGEETLGLWKAGERYLAARSGRDTRLWLDADTLDEAFEALEELEAALTASAEHGSGSDQPSSGQGD